MPAAWFLFSVLAACQDRQDVVAALPTGGGKTFIAPLVAALMRTTVIVVAPMQRLVQQQVSAAAAMLGSTCVYRLSRADASAGLEAFLGTPADRGRVVVGDPESWLAPGVAAVLGAAAGQDAVCRPDHSRGLP